MIILCRCSLSRKNQDLRMNSAGNESQRRSRCVRSYGLHHCSFSLVMARKLILARKACWRFTPGLSQSRSRTSLACLLSARGSNSLRSHCNMAGCQRLSFKTKVNSPLDLNLSLPCSFTLHFWHQPKPYHFLSYTSKGRKA